MPLLEGQRCGVTGASGSLGRALLLALHRQGAIPVALSSSPGPVRLQDGERELEIETIAWQVGEEEAVRPELESLQLLVINHGINRMRARDAQATADSLAVNLSSALRLMELFFETTKPGDGRELWVNTSEAEVNPAFSPLYEICLLYTSPSPRD